MMTKIFYDVETTGTNFRKHCIHQIGLMVEREGEIVEKADIRMRPHVKAIIDDAALEVCGKTLEELNTYQYPVKAYQQLTSILSKYVNKYDSKDKAWLIGYNNRAFDDLFIRKFFELCGDRYFGCWFWSDTIDVICLASEYLKGERRKQMPSFKLKRVALELGLEVDELELHNAFYDIVLTRQIYRIVTGIDLEI